MEIGAPILIHPQSPTLAHTFRGVLRFVLCTKQQKHALQLTPVIGLEGPKNVVHYNRKFTITGFTITGVNCNT